MPPAVRIVLSLREDYLGFLEEAAEHIPQILDARFRLAPLDLHAAEEAIVGPAAVSDPGLRPGRSRSTTTRSPRSWTICRSGGRARLGRPGATSSRFSCN